ncbi:MAG: hypothetical protein NC299_16100 [Lachnospiraceae bacterium]|nr:hypothetical protein [Ruminococcus sp.]MCM1276858.1 hypothetical protein [Lachnospiraceae bacterium]
MMRVLFCELRKLFSSGIFIFIVSAAVILNLYLCLTAKPVEVSDERYRTFYDKFETLPSGKIITELNAELENFYNGELSLETINQRDFLQNELQQAELIANYENYLAEIDASAERMTSVSIFAKKDSFSYKNITRTPAAYNAVREVKPVYSRSEGILLAIDNSACDIMLIFCALTAVVVLIVRERESGITALIKPLRHGRSHLAAAKSAAVLLCYVSVGILIYGGALTVGAARFGLGDLSRPAQSLKGFIGCNLPISVGAAISLIIAVKIAAAFLAALIFECLCTAFYSIYAYISAAVSAAAEVILYAAIDGNSWAAVFGKINLAAFSQSAEIFKNYLNINIFGEPCNIISVTIISLTVGIAGFFILQNFLFSRIEIKDFKTRQLIPPPRIIPKKPFSYAAYKQFITHRGALIILLILGIQIYLSANYRIEFNADDMQYRAYCEQFTQMTEQQADEFAETEKHRFEELHERVLTADFNEIMKIYDELNAESGFERAYEQQRYISALDSENKAMFYQTGWRRLFAANGYAEDMRLTLFAALGICFAVSPLIAYDNRRRLGFLLYTNLHGKREYFHRNITVSAIVSTFISIAVNAPHILGILSLYKTDGAGFSIRCIPEFERFFDIPIFAYIALLCVLRMLSLILCGWIILFISSKCKNVSAALLISTAVFALPVMLYLAGAEFVLPLCMPFSVNREIIENTWQYAALIFVFCAVAAIRTELKLRGNLKT